MTGPSIPSTGPDRERMTFSAFMGVMVKQTYVWQMARGGVYSDRPALAASARTRRDRAQRRIDDAVLQRAAVINDERRCAAVGTAAGALVAAVRCEYPRGHAKVPGRRVRTASGGAVDTVPSVPGFDHGAPGAGVWWNETSKTESKGND